MSVYMPIKRNGRVVSGEKKQDKRCNRYVANRRKVKKQTMRENTKYVSGIKRSGDIKMVQQEYTFGQDKQRQPEEKISEKEE
jgi:hypothetical protein